MEKIEFRFVTILFVTCLVHSSAGTSEEIIEENFENGFGDFWKDVSTANISETAYWSTPISGNMSIGPRPPSVDNNGFIEVVPVNSSRWEGMATLRSSSTSFNPGATLELTYWIAYPPNAGRTVALVVYTWADGGSINKTRVFTSSISSSGPFDSWLTQTIDLGITASSTFQLEITGSRPYNEDTGIAIRKTKIRNYAATTTKMSSTTLTSVTEANPAVSTSPMFINTHSSTEETPTTTIHTTAQFSSTTTIDGSTIASSTRSTESSTSSSPSATSDMFDETTTSIATPSTESSTTSSSSISSEIFDGTTITSSTATSTTENSMEKSSSSSASSENLETTNPTSSNIPTSYTSEMIFETSSSTPVEEVTNGTMAASTPTSNETELWTSTQETTNLPTDSTQSSTNPVSQELVLGLSIGLSFLLAMSILGCLLVWFFFIRPKGKLFLSARAFNAIATLALEAPPKRHALTYPKLDSIQEKPITLEHERPQLISALEEGSIRKVSTNGDSTSEGSTSDSQSTLPLSQTSERHASVNIANSIAHVSETPLFYRFRLPRPQVYSILPYLRFNIPRAHRKQV